jgi:hypothetical protein
MWYRHSRDLNYSLHIYLHTSVLICKTVIHTSRLLVCGTHTYLVSSNFLCTLDFWMVVALFTSCLRLTSESFVVAVTGPWRWLIFFSVEKCEMCVCVCVRVREHVGCFVACTTDRPKHVATVRHQYRVMLLCYWQNKLLVLLWVLKHSMILSFKILRSICR